jgi:hypothetical protein
MRSCSGATSAAAFDLAGPIRSRAELVEPARTADRRSRPTTAKRCSSGRCSSPSRERSPIATRPASASGRSAYTPSSGSSATVPPCHWPEGQEPRRVGRGPCRFEGCDPGRSRPPEIVSRRVDRSAVRRLIHHRWHATGCEADRGAAVFLSQPARASRRRRRGLVLPLRSAVAVAPSLPRRASAVPLGGRSLSRTGTAGHRALNRHGWRRDLPTVC